MSMRLSRSIVGEAEAEAVRRVIVEDGYLGMGHETCLFEQELAAYLGVAPEQVVTTNTGTAALTLAVDAIAPVSYTHLDVYKRQSWDSALVCEVPLLPIP